MSTSINQDISLIRFVNNMEYLKDDLINGFKLSNHLVTFEATTINNILEMFDIWEEIKISNATIVKLKQIRQNTSNSKSFGLQLANEITKDSSFKWQVIALTGGVSFEVPMKSFTEVRFNQKLHRYHLGFFGQYGIQLTKEWASRNKATPVIYVGRNSETSKRLGTLVSILNTFRGKFTMNALFNFLALIEVGVNAYEFEWRIVGDHQLFLSEKKEQPRIKIELKDIVGLYVKSKNEKDKLKEYIENKLKEGLLIGSIPEIYLTNDILLSDDDIKLIEEISKR